jgi:hypothetical protein
MNSSDCRAEVSSRKQASEVSSRKRRSRLVSRRHGLVSVSSRKQASRGDAWAQGEFQRKHSQRFCGANTVRDSQFHSTASFTHQPSFNPCLVSIKTPRHNSQRPLGSLRL